MVKPRIAIIHISDLHIGELHPVSGDGPVSEYSAYFEIFDGYLGHSFKSLKRLERFWNDISLVTEASEVELLVTGDLSAIGTRDQLELATSFLGGEIYHEEKGFVGLRCGNWKMWAVPGNHDHWGTKTIVSKKPSLVWRPYFRELPYSEPDIKSKPRKISDSASLRIIGLDSDADVEPLSNDRAFGYGKFFSHLNFLDQRLPVQEKNEIRVLVLHHSRAHRGKILEMDEDCRKALDEFLADHGISVILTGHTHYDAIIPFKAGKHPVLEACCGSTTQITTLPLDMRNLFGKRPKRQIPPNTLLVHEICEDEMGLLWWQVKVFVEKSRGFVEDRGKKQKPFKLLELD